jgi:hypothetical protein
MTDDEIPLTWEDVETSANRMFNVWVYGDELKWAKECWGHFEKHGLAGQEGSLENTAAFLRLVSLALIYQEFCGYAWEENPETPITDLAEDIPDNDLALGILAGAADQSAFADCCDMDELREAALIAICDSQRKEIFDCLCKGFGGYVQLYSSMSKTYPTDDDDDDDDDNDEMEVTGANAQALDFVSNGFR